MHRHKHLIKFGYFQQPEKCFGNIQQHQATWKCGQVIVHPDERTQAGTVDVHDFRQIKHKITMIFGHQLVKSLCKHLLLLHPQQIALYL